METEPDPIAYFFCMVLVIWGVIVALVLWVLSMIFKPYDNAIQIAVEEEAQNSTELLT